MSRKPETLLTMSHGQMAFLTSSDLLPLQNLLFPPTLPTLPCWIYRLGKGELIPAQSQMVQSPYGRIVNPLWLEGQRVEL